MKTLSMDAVLIGFFTVHNRNNARDTRRNGYNIKKFNEIEKAQKHTELDFHSFSSIVNLPWKYKSEDHKIRKYIPYDKSRIFKNVITIVDTVTLL